MKNSRIILKEMQRNDCSIQRFLQLPKLFKNSTQKYDIRTISAKKYLPHFK